MDRLYVDGWAYMQQGRRCGKPTCRCAHGELHGPYWYRRHRTTRRQQYLGRTLPAEIARHVAERAALAPTIQAHIAQLAADQVLLSDLLAGTRTLSVADQRRLVTLGYGSVLGAARLAMAPDTGGGQEGAAGSVETHDGRG